MTNRVADAAQHMKPETVECLQELIYALKDTVNHHSEAADKIDDPFVKSELVAIAAERKDIYETIGGFITLADETPVEEGTWLGSLHACWTAFRAGLNSGDASVVLIEAARVEESILAKFKSVLPEIAGNPVNDMLLKYFETVKSGHDRVIALRDAFQSA